jgi:hypothetical protein
MNANADVLQRSELIGSRTREVALTQVGVVRETNEWNPEDFAREQIRGLVQRVFFMGGSQTVRQVVFSAVGSNTGVANICDHVGQALALETRAHVAIVGREHRAWGKGAIKSWSTQAAVNLWRVPGFSRRECGEESGTGPYWLARLSELRNQFEYAVIHGPAAGISSEAALLGQLADGIILVLGAHSTRRATARKIKETLEGAQSRILGTVLSERRFPVPERIYHRL